jgi:hypothetical protein
MAWSGNVALEVEALFHEAQRARYGVLPRAGEEPAAVTPILDRGKVTSGQRRIVGVDCRRREA